MAAEPGDDDALMLPRPVPQHRPKVWLLADRRGWAYDQLCRGVATTVADEFECRIAYVAEQPDLAAWDFDLVLVCFWGETYHQRFVDDQRRVIKLVSSHRWQQDAYGCLTPPRFVATHLADAGTIGATSLRLVDLLRGGGEVLHTPQGVELDHFVAGPPKNGAAPLVFGWAGNGKDPCKGLGDVLAPAAAGFELRIADGDRDAVGMAEFYRSIDVLLVGSTQEGEPRTLLEAMASGCYVVATDVGIVPECVEHGVNGLIVERSVHAFRAAMQSCADNAAEVRAAGRDNRQRMAAARSWPHVKSSWRLLLHRAWQRVCARTTGQIGTGQIGTGQMRTGQLGTIVASRPHPAARTTDREVVARCKDDYHQHFDTLNDPGPDTVTAAAAYYRVELLPQLPADHDTRLLDVGSGYGLLLRFLHDHGYRDLHGVELDATLHDRSRRWLADRATIRCGDAIEFLRAHEASFDVITAWDILEHFPLGEALDFATAVRQALRPGGVALFRTPNMANVLGIYSRCMDLTHQVGFTEQSAAQLLRLAGFDGVDLVVPDFTGEPTLTAGVGESRRFHEQLFALQDRSTPKCFDKNLVMAARVAKAATLPAVATTTVLEPAEASASPRRTVLYVVDEPGWAHDHKSRNLVRCLADRYDGRVVYQQHVTADDLDRADLIVIWYWRQLQAMCTVLGDRLAATLARNRDKLLMGVCSHNELEDQHRTPGLAVLQRLPARVFTHSSLLEAEVRPLLPGTESWCLPNGVDADLFTPGPGRELGTGQPLRVGWAGSLDNFGPDMRGVTTVIEPAFAELQTRDPGAFELAVAAREQQLRTHEQMRDFYRSLDVYVCASRVEGTPNPALEAAACGVPVVSTRVGNMPELIEHGINGLLIERRPQQLAAALLVLQQRPQLRCDMGRRLRATIEQSWHWPLRAEGFARMFDEVLCAVSQAHTPAKGQRATPIAGGAR